MTATLPPLIESLRNELQQYGEMLALLEAQRNLIPARDPDTVLSSVSALEAQGAAIQAARQSREELQRQLGWALGRPEGGDFHELLPLVPGDYRPLIGALVQEINQLLERVREHAGCNLQQLRRSVESMERFLATLFPEAPSARLAGETEASQTDLPAASSRV